MPKTSSMKILEKDIALEGECFLPDLSEAQKKSSIPVILCHPHPLYGGDMYNNVVSALFEEFANRGVPVIRFNFRGAGESTGSHAGGIGEIDDVKEVVHTFCEITKTNRAFIAGYSFGAAVGGAAAAEIPTILGYAAIAMPFDLFPEHARRMNCTKPKLFVQGTEDEVAKYSRFNLNVKKITGPLEVREIQGADHFFEGYSRQAAEYVGDFYNAFMKK